MLPILVSSDYIQNNLLVFILNSPGMAEKRKALSPLNILPKEIRIIIITVTESSARRKKTLTLNLLLQNWNKYLFQSCNWQNIPAKYYTTDKIQKKFRKFEFKTRGAS